MGQSDERLREQLATLKRVAQALGYADAAVFLGQALMDSRVVGTDKPEPPSRGQSARS